MTHPEVSEKGSPQIQGGDAEAIAGRLTEAQRSMMLRAKREWLAQAPRCFGPGITKKALRERGLAHGDCAYLTPLGEAVRAYLLERQS